MSPRNVYVRGRAVWAPGYPSAQAWLAGEPDEAAQKPPASIVGGRMKRATSPMCQTAIEVTTRAAADADFDPARCATVFGSCHGEIEIAFHQLEMMRDGEGIISPARFKNSVHNTAAGLFTIGAGNHGFTTAIAGGPHTFALSMLEAWALVASGEHDEVVFSTTEEPLPSFIACYSDHGLLGVAIALSARGDGALARVEVPSPSKTAVDHPPIGPAFEGHVAAPGLALIRALEDGWRGPLGLTPPGGGAAALGAEVPGGGWQTRLVDS